MLYIDKENSGIIQAREIHIAKVACRVRRRTGGNRCTELNCTICNSRVVVIQGIPQKLREILHDQHFLEILIGGEPDELSIMAEMLWSELIPSFSINDYEEFLKANRKKPKNRSFTEYILIHKYNYIYQLFFKIFDYDFWFLNSSNLEHYDAYSLAKSLERNTCTYCNRLYTNTIKTIRKEKVMRPTFDHWFSHSAYPMLGLSFYNLIPSCSICNSSTKGAKAFLLNSHIHPYMDRNVVNQFSYGYHFFRSINKYEIFMTYDNPKALKTMSDLKLKEIYSAHYSELNDMIQIKKAYSEKYIDTMVNTFSGIRLSHKEAYRLAFGVEMDEKEFHKRPLSKFKKDILTKLNLTNFD